MKTRQATTTSRRFMLSAAQPQPNARLMATALVAGIPLWRTAL